MKYYYPDYFNDFKCVGGKACPDSCCIVWQINVDKETLKKYKNVGGELGCRMAEKINQKTGQIMQHGEERRCEFLNDDNLCDIVSELGEGYLSETCHTHPRHEEVYDNVRERSLAITCPIACKTLLEREEPVVIKTEEVPSKKEHDRYFDEPLFEQVIFTRDEILKLEQNRNLSIAKRMTLVLGLSHDIERRFRKRAERKKNGIISKLFPSHPQFSLDEKEAIHRIAAEYQKDNAYEKMSSHIKKEAMSEKIILDTEATTSLGIMTDMIFSLCTMEALKVTWIPYIQSVLNIRSEFKENEYNDLQKEFSGVLKETALEQLLFYFSYVYCGGSVYDEMLCAKIKMAVVNTLIIRELWFMKWLENNKSLNIDEQTEIAHWYVREIENSDENMEQWDSLMQRNPRFSLKNILTFLSKM